MQKENTKTRTPSAHFFCCSFPPFLSSFTILPSPHGFSFLSTYSLRFSVFVGFVRCTSKNGRHFVLHFYCSNLSKISIHRVAPLTQTKHSRTCCSFCLSRESERGSDACADPYSNLPLLLLPSRLLRVAMIDRFTLFQFCYRGCIVIGAQQSLCEQFIYFKWRDCMRTLLLSEICATSYCPARGEVKIKRT